MPNLPKGFHPKTNGGITVPKRCPDCTVSATDIPDACPGINLSKEAFLITKVPQNDWRSRDEYVQYVWTEMQERIAKFHCAGKKLLTTGIEEYSNMRASRGKEQK